jgi:hypothetical protein
MSPEGIQLASRAQEAIADAIQLRRETATSNPVDRAVVGLILDA